MLGHALFMSDSLKCVSDDMKNIKRYLELIKNQEAFKKLLIHKTLLSFDTYIKHEKKLLSMVSQRFKTA